MTPAGTQAVPPKIKNTAPLALFAGAVAAFVIGCGLVFIYFFNPSTHGFYPTCLFHQLTGLNCPGCGSTRGLYALLHGNFLIALRDNALFVLSLAGGAIWGARFLIRKTKEPRVIPSIFRQNLSGRIWRLPSCSPSCGTCRPFLSFHRRIFGFCRFLGWCSISGL